MNKDYTIGIYIRLSMADEDAGNGSKAESDSIGNQRMLINRYLDNHPTLSKYPRLEFADDGGPLLGAIPEEEHTLAEFLARTLGRGNRLERVGVHARVPGFRTDGHRCGREVLHLFQLEIQLFGFGC